MTRARTMLSALGLFVVLAAVTCGAQPAAGDIIVTGIDTAGIGGLTLRLDPVSGAVTTLIAKLGAPRQQWSGNWVEMGPDNREVWVAHAGGQLQGAIFVLDAAGRVSSIRPVSWRTDCFRFRSDGDLTWSGLGTYLTNRLILSDADFGSLWALASNLPPVSLCHQEIEESGLIAVAFQDVHPAGGIASVDPQAAKIVRTLTGLGMVNTLDYDPTSGMVHAVEFGSPQSPTAYAGSLLEVDFSSGKVTSLIDASQGGGVAVDRLNWIHRRLDGTLLLGARHRVFVFDLAARKIVKTWAVAGDRSFAITGGTVYGRRMIRLDTSHGTRPGSTVDIHACFPHALAPGSSYWLGCSNGLRPGIDFGTAQLDLQFDPVLTVCLLEWMPNVFRNFRGLLDASGRTKAQFALPDIPGLYDVRFFIGGIALINGAVEVTNVEAFTVTR